MVCYIKHNEHLKYMYNVGTIWSTLKRRFNLQNFLQIFFKYYPRQRAREGATRIKLTAVSWKRSASSKDKTRFSLFSKRLPPKKNYILDHENYEKITLCINYKKKKQNGSPELINLDQKNYIH